MYSKKDIMCDVRALREEVRKLRPLLTNTHTELNSVVDYFLADALCPMCGEPLKHHERATSFFDYFPSNTEHRLECPKDGFAICCDSFKGCMDTLRMIETKAKEKSGE